MAGNSTFFSLSRHAAAVADQMKESGIFPDAIVAAKFGMAYAIKYYWDEIGSSEELKRLDQTYDAQGNHYNVGTVDPDDFISQIIRSLYPDSDSPYPLARALMCFGLNQLGDLLEDGRLFPINKNM